MADEKTRDLMNAEAAEATPTPGTASEEKVDKHSLLGQWRAKAYDQKADRGRKEGKAAHSFTAFQGRLQKAPEGSRNHDARREPGQDPLQRVGDALLQREDQRRAKTRTNKRDQNAEQDLRVQTFAPPSSGTSRLTSM